MPAEKLKEYLEDNHIQYRFIPHSLTYTARETASCAHVPEKDFAKTVMVKIDSELAMVVIPASQKVNLDQLKKVTGASNTEIARETEFKDIFPDCEVGAMPPFGNLYGIPVFISARLKEDEEIVFNAGSHTELVGIPYQAYEGLVSPQAIAYPG